MFVALPASFVPDLESWEGHLSAIVGAWVRNDPSGSASTVASGARATRPREVLTRRIGKLNVKHLTAACGLLVSFHCRRVYLSIKCEN